MLHGIYFRPKFYTSLSHFHQDDTNISDLFVISRLLVDDLQLAEGHNSFLARVLESDCDVLALDRTRAGDTELSLKCGRFGATNLVCRVGGWRAGVSHRHIIINQSIVCKLNTILLLCTIHNSGEGRKRNVWG